jgi:hypothetical protein
MQDMTAVTYDEAETTIDAVLNAPRIEEVRLARELSEHFRQQYKRARAVAEGR